MKPAILFAGAGAVGASAALLAARSLPNTEITVLDSGSPRHAGNKTFVLGASNCARLWEQGLDKILAPCAHNLRALQTSFAGSFGSIVLSGADIMTDLIGRTFVETDLVGALRAALSAAPNVEIVNDAQVSAVHPGKIEAVVAWDNGKQKRACQLAVVAGLPRGLLEPAGFKWHKVDYDQQALIADIRGGLPRDIASERLTATGTMTLIPNRSGWGHIWLDSEEKLSSLRRHSHVDVIRLIEKEHGVELGEGASIKAFASYQPARSMVGPAALRRVVLLGATACSVHPIGAQELNLGLRDGLTLASLLAESANCVHERFAEDFALQRTADRAHVAKITDIAARIASCYIPGKLTAAGALAFLAGLLPPVRKRLLAAWVLHN